MAKCVCQYHVAALPSIGKCGEEAAVGFPVLVESATNPVAPAETLTCIEPSLDRLVQILLWCWGHSQLLSYS